MSRLVFISNPWASGEIRGRQIAGAIGGVVDPETVHPDDVLVCIKSHPSDALVEYVRRVYVDVDDNSGLMPYLSEHPEVVPIAASVVGQQYINEHAGRDDTIVIPPHHCNFERAMRVQKSPPTIQTAGFIGYEENLHLDCVKLTEALAAIGIKFVTKFDAATREDVCEFYHSIDIQITFRKPDAKVNPAPELRDVTKLINAGSFGIPTVATPEPTYVDEFNGCFLPVESLYDVVQQCKRLLSDGWLYHHLSVAALDRAEQYHISHVAPVFANLLAANSKLPISPKHLWNLFEKYKAQKTQRHAVIYTQVLMSIPRAKIRLLEIGVADGRSMQAWREYVPEATLFGIDVSPATEVIDGATVYMGNQSDVAFLASVVKQTGPLDVVIDDGSHKSADQIESVRALLPHVLPGGYYVIEDLDAESRGPTVDFVKSLNVDYELLLNGQQEVDVCVIRVH